MENRPIDQLLERFEPIKAPHRSDAMLMATAEVTARHQSAECHRRRWLAGLAAALLLGATLMISPTPLQRNHDSYESLDPWLSVAATTTISQTGLTVRAKLLELKLARLEKLAGMTDNSERYEPDLDAMKRELETLERLFINTSPAERTPSRSARDLKEGTQDETDHSIIDPHQRCPRVRFGYGVLPG